MDEMSAFERQVADELDRMAGPARGIDPMAMVRTVVTPASPAPVPTRRLRNHVVPAPRDGGTTVFALKFAAAAALVALFGGLLLAAVLTTEPADDVAPATTSESSSPVTTEELLSGLVTEEVEAGVFRVVSDGVRDLARPVSRDVDLDVERGRIVTGLDGSVWLFRPDRLFKLGAVGQEAPGWGWFDQEADIEVGPDGRVWLIAEREGGLNDLVTFADTLDPEDAQSAWSNPALPENAEREYLSVEVDPDGELYRAWVDAPAGDADDRKVNIEAFRDGWVAHPPLTFERDIERWDLAAGGPGDYVWLAHLDSDDDPSRLGSHGTSLADPPIEPWQLDVGLDDSVWIQALDLGAPASEPEGTVPESCGLRLARFDGTAWRTWGRDDGVPDVGSVYWLMGCWPGIHAAAPDGSVWLASRDYLPARECSGIANFDGATWAHFLDGRCVYDAAVAPDGAVWLQAGEVSYAEPTDYGDDVDRHFEPVETYVITPGAGPEALSAADTAMDGA